MNTNNDTTQPNPPGDILALMGSDAKKWAHEFAIRCLAYSENKGGFDTPDEVEEFAFGWFANAIMIGHDHGYARAREDHTDGLTFSNVRHANVERQKEWDGDAQFSELFFGAALSGEGGELAEIVLALQVQAAIGKANNIVKKMERGRLGLAGSRATLQELGKELADVLTYVDLLAHKVGLDLASCWVNKYNEVSDKYGMHSYVSIDGKYFRSRE